MVLAFVRGPFAVAGAILVALGLGYWGFRSLDGLDLGVADSLYRSLQLFNIDAQLPPDGALPWQLEVARFLAPLAIAYAALAAIFALLRQQVQRLLTRLFARNHVVVIGLGDRGSRLARSLRQGHHVVAIEQDGNNGAARALRQQGTTVLAGDGRDREVLRTARVDRAGHVVVMTTDDSSNLEIVASLAGVVNPDRPALQHVGIEGASLWAELHRLPLQRETARRRVEFFSIPDRTAQALVDRAERDVGGSPAREVLIRGEGAVAARLIVRIARSAAFEGVTAIRLASRAPGAVLEEVHATDPWISERWDIETPPLHEASAPWAFVCGLPEANALTAAAAISRHRRATQIFVAVQDDDVEGALAGSGLVLRGTTLVPAEQEVLSEVLLSRPAVEVIAMGKHADYLAQQRTRGDTPATNPSMASWEELPESLRESNRRFAEGVADALSELGAELAPLAGPPTDGLLEIPPTALEAMARFEHDRWVRDQMRDGWEPTEGEKDPDRKLHPMLVDWEKLSEEEREKDRDGIRALPELLVRVGYELRMPERA